MVTTKFSMQKLAKNFHKPIKPGSE